MKALARQFPTVQQRLCDRIDTLIALNSVEVETELGELIIEVRLFNQNRPLLFADAKYLLSI